jgi:hypothetical protein
MMRMTTTRTMWSCSAEATAGKRSFSRARTHKRAAISGLMPA